MVQLCVSLYIYLTIYLCIIYLFIISSVSNYIHRKLIFLVEKYLRQWENMNGQSVLSKKNYFSLTFDIDYITHSKVLYSD